MNPVTEAQLADWFGVPRSVWFHLGLSDGIQESIFATVTALQQQVATLTKERNVADAMVGSLQRNFDERLREATATLTKERDTAVQSAHRYKVDLAEAQALTDRVTKAGVAAQLQTNDLTARLAEALSERDDALFGERQANGLRMNEIGVSAGLRTERDAAVAQVAVLTAERRPAMSDRDLDALRALAEAALSKGLENTTYEAINYKRGLPAPHHSRPARPAGGGREAGG